MSNLVELSKYNVGNRDAVLSRHRAAHITKSAEHIAKIVSKLEQLAKADTEEVVDDLAIDVKDGLRDLLFDVKDSIQFREAFADGDAK